MVRLGFAILIGCAVLVALSGPGQQVYGGEVGGEVAALQQVRASQVRTVSYDLGDGVVLRMVVVPAGEFDMGSLETEKYHNKDEGPVRHVRITHKLEVSQFEITQDVWQKVMGWNPCEDRGPRRPVTNVEWYDCIVFCNRLSKMLGFERPYSGWGEDVVCDWSANGFRLPTEAEWEYLCRAGTRTAYSTGDRVHSDPGKAVCDALDCIGWYRYNSHGRLHLVGEQEPNAFGLYDMHGNVWEWCWDRYQSDAYSKADNVDPKGPASGHNRVLRGGCYDSYEEACRSAFRSFAWQGASSKTIGFRVVRTID